jgi:hypothetical protein
MAPRLPVTAVKTWAVRQSSDRTVKVACERAAPPCWSYLKGWETFLDEKVPAQAEAARWIRHESGRTFTETTGGGLTVFRFGPGQRCFTEHRTRPQQWVERDGDWRGRGRGAVLLHKRPADWQESFGEHQDRLATAIERG